MKPDFMRFVDRYIGGPICFFLSIENKLRKLIFKKPPGQIKKILFIELSEMGSSILAYSSLKKAKELFDAELFFLIFEENKESVTLLDIIPKNNLLTIRSKNILLLMIDTFKIIKKIKKHKIDTIIDLELFSRFSSILSYASRPSRISAFYKYHQEGLYRGNFHTDKVVYNPYYHISKNFLSLVYSLNEKTWPKLKKNISENDIVVYQRRISQHKKNVVLSKLKKITDIKKEDRLVIINPNASQLLPIRKWPLENWIELSKKLVNKGYRLIIIGNNLDKEDAQIIKKIIPECIDFTGKTSLKELVTLFSLSDLLITNDSGPAHFASLTNIPKITLFGPETPLLYGPLGNSINLYSELACSPCVSAHNHRKTSCKDNICLKSISVEQVYKEASKILS